VKTGRREKKGIGGGKAKALAKKIDLALQNLNGELHENITISRIKKINETKSCGRKRQDEAKDARKEGLEKDRTSKKQRRWTGGDSG